MPLHSCGDDIRHSESLQGHAHVAAAALTHIKNIPFLTLRNAWALVRTRRADPWLSLRELAESQSWVCLFP